MTILINEKTDKFTYESIFPVSISETDCAGRVKPIVILNYMQDIAEKSINKYNKKLSCDELISNGLGWFLIRYRIEFENNLQNIKELKIQTESRGSQRLNAYRDFEVFDNISSKRILRATTSWLIVNLNSKSVINISQEYPELFSYTKREDDLILQKLKTPDTIDFEKLFSVRYDDLDVNKHVNNTTYITWALETLDYNFRNSHTLKNLDIYFKHEAKYGDDILAQVKYNSANSTTEHIIKNAKTGEDLCQLKAEYMKR